MAEKKSNSMEMEKEGEEGGVSVFIPGESDTCGTSLEYDPDCDTEFVVNQISQEHGVKGYLTRRNRTRRVGSKTLPAGAYHFHITQRIAPQPAADSIVRPSSPNFTPSVWILCTLNPLEAVGTAWIASDRKVVTVFHNIAKDPQNSKSRAILEADWAVVSKLERNRSRVCVPLGSVVVPVKVAKFNALNDWAVMERVDELTFPPSLVLKVCEVGEIPRDGSETKLKVFHCPVSMFNEGLLDICGCTSLESRLSLKTEHKMYVEVGMFRGSSGGIFAFTIPGGEHRVLGMHTEGCNTARSIAYVKAEDPDLNDLEVAAVASDSCANNHGSFSMGITVAKYRPLMAAIRA